MEVTHLSDVKTAGSVGITSRLRVERPKNRSSIPGSNRRHYFHQTVLIASGDHPTHPMGTVGVSQADEVARGAKLTTHPHLISS
jgi:hypothetical protein